MTKDKVGGNKNGLGFYELCRLPLWINKIITKEWFPTSWITVILWVEGWRGPTR